jgi:ATP-dependent Lon protease
VEEDIDEMLVQAKDNGMKPKVIRKELSKMRRMNLQAPDFGIQRNYLDFRVTLERLFQRYTLKRQKNLIGIIWVRRVKKKNDRAFSSFKML